MDWKLLDFAKQAQDTASNLNVVLEEIPQYATDITGDIAELYAISSRLRTLHNDLELSRYGRRSTRILRHLNICLPSLEFTLDEVRDMFNKRDGRQHPGAFPGTPPYLLIWEQSLADLEIQGMALPTRLETYRKYLESIDEILKGAEADENTLLLQRQLSKLLKKQEPIDDSFNKLSIHVSKHGSRTPLPQPAATGRPNIERYQTYPSYTSPPLIPSQAPPIVPPQSPSYGDIPYMPSYPPHSPMQAAPPPVPEIPQSPTYSSASSQTFSTISNDSAGSVAHWGMRIFDGRSGSTPFDVLGQPTKCLGRDEPIAIERLENDGFLKILELPFEATNVWIRLYWRPDDNRARILFMTLDPNGRKMKFCFPLTGIKTLRSGSCLQLCRVNRQDGQFDLWANLRFANYERIVLFYNTMVTMKRQDRTTSPPGLEDYFGGETLEFGGEICDDEFLHAFQILRDDETGAFRFEATARRGPWKSIPIWTAFITQYIGNTNWMKRIRNTDTIVFRDLVPYLFCEGYRLPRDPKSNRYQLTFTSRDDAVDFLGWFHATSMECTE